MKERTLYVSSPAMFRNKPVAFLVVVALCFVIVGIPILLLWWLRCKGTTLTVTNERTTLRHGILSKAVNEVWHRDVRNVRIDQSLMQRLLNVGDIALSSAGQAGIEISVSGVPGPNRIKALIDEHRRVAA